MKSLNSSKRGNVKTLLLKKFITSSICSSQGQQLVPAVSNCSDNSHLICYHPNIDQLSPALLAIVTIYLIFSGLPLRYWP